MNVKPQAEIQAFLAPYASALGLEILDCKWDARTKTLSVTVDCENGVDMNLLETFHRSIDAPLDEFDPTYGEGYTLTCSSAGLDRPFLTPRDFERNLHKKVEVSLYAADEGKKYYEGELVSHDEESFTVLTEGREKRFSKSKTAKICLLIEV